MCCDKKLYHNIELFSTYGTWIICSCTKKVITGAFIQMWTTVTFFGCKFARVLLRFEWMARTHPFSKHIEPIIILKITKFSSCITQRITYTSRVLPLSAVEIVARNFGVKLGHREIFIWIGKYSCGLRIFYKASYRLHVGYRGITVCPIIREGNKPECLLDV